MSANFNKRPHNRPPHGFSIQICFHELERFQHVLTACIPPEVSMKGCGAHFIVTYLLLFKGVVIQ